MRSKLWKRHGASLGERRERKGMLFLIPWVIGFIFFFVKPMAESMYYTFNTVSFGNEGLEYEAAGWTNYASIFGDKSFLQNLSAAWSSILYQVPLVVLFSLMVALLLNKQFPGRLLFRSVFFVPLIVMSTVVTGIMNDVSGYATLGESGNNLVNFDFGVDGFFTNILSALGIGSTILEEFSGLFNNLFSISWSSALQIILYLTALQTIPESYYEVCSIEGATSWESFWKITFPCLSPITLVCLVYTIVDTFSHAKLVDSITNMAEKSLHLSATMAWVYFLGVFVYIIVIYAVVSRWVKYMD